MEKVSLKSFFKKWLVVKRDLFAIIKNLNKSLVFIKTKINALFGFNMIPSRSLKSFCNHSGFFIQFKINFQGFGRLYEKILCKCRLFDLMKKSYALFQKVLFFVFHQLPENSLFEFQLLYFFEL